MAKQLDPVDREILRCLLNDGRASIQAVADQVGLRRPAVHARVKRLESLGVIRGYRVVLDPQALDRGLAAFVFLKVAHGIGKDFLDSTTEIVRQLGEFAAVQEIHTLAGEDDMIVKVRTSSLAELEDNVLRRLSGMPNVTRVHSRIVLSTRLERSLSPLPAEAKPAPRKPRQSKYD